MQVFQSRRDFLRLACSCLGASCVAGCNDSATDTAARPAARFEAVGLADPGVLAGLEKPKLRVGFIPITCATPFIMAGPQGFYAKHGLDVTLVKFGGYAEIRDALIAGEIDASHVLSPMPLVMSAGIGSVAVPTRLAVIGNINGCAITMARKHEKALASPKGFRGKVIAIAFEHSMPNFLLRNYLASIGLDPDRDVDIRIMRPPDMLANLVAGNIDGFLGPDPQNQRAVAEGAGFIHKLSRDLWNGHPCCGFAVLQRFIDANPRPMRRCCAPSPTPRFGRTTRPTAPRSPPRSRRQDMSISPPVDRGGARRPVRGRPRPPLSVPDRIDFDPIRGTASGYGWRRRWCAGDCCPRPAEDAGRFRRPGELGL